MIGALTGLLCCQLAGELLARLLRLPVPGPVIGFALLFGLLLLRGRPASPEMGAVSGTLLGNLGLLFVPAGVGVVLHLPTLARNWLPLAAAVVAGTLLTVALTGRMAQALLRRGEAPPRDVPPPRAEDAP